MPFRKAQNGWGKIKPLAGFNINRGHPLSAGMQAGFIFNEEGPGIAKDITDNGWDCFPAYGGNAGVGSPNMQNNTFVPFVTGGVSPFPSPNAGKSIVFPTQANEQIFKSKRTSQMIGPNDPITIVIKHNTTLSANNMQLLSKWDSDSQSGFAFFSAGGTGQGLNLPRNSADYQCYVNGFDQGSPINNQWLQIGVSGQIGVTPTFYVDGLGNGRTANIAAGSGNHNGDSGFALTIGGFTTFGSAGTAYYQGAIDFIYIYNRILSAVEHHQLWAEPFIMFQPPRIRRIINRVIPFTTGTANIASPSLVNANGTAIKKKSASIVSPSAVTAAGTAIKPKSASVTSQSIVTGHLTNLQQGHANILSPSIVRGKRSPGVPLETTSVANLSAIFSTITQLGAST